MGLRLLRRNNFDKIAFLSLVRDGDVVFDIGANRGNFTLLFSHIVGNQGRVHAFEPVLPTFRALSERAAKEQHFPNVSLNHFALGEKAGNFEIHIPAGDFGQASLQKHSAGSWSKPGTETLTCEVRTLDSYWVEQQLTKIDFIKIDVEGAELPALRGGLKLLNQFHPVIHLEFCPDWTDAFGYNLPDIFSLLQGHGYQYFYQGDLTPMETSFIPSEKTASCNIICSTKPLP